LTVLGQCYIPHNLHLRTTIPAAGRLQTWCVAQSVEPPLLLDVHAAARLLGISVWTVRALIREGALRHVRAGRKLWVPAEELRRWVNDTARYSQLFP